MLYRGRVLGHIPYDNGIGAQSRHSRMDAMSRMMLTRGTCKNRGIFFLLRDIWFGLFGDIKMYTPSRN